LLFPTAHTADLFGTAGELDPEASKDRVAVATAAAAAATAAPTSSQPSNKNIVWMRQMVTAAAVADQTEN
jgi:hypothetical protein